MENNRAEVTSIRIISVDHYQSSPVAGLDHGYSKFRGCQAKQVPVIRIFGSTLAGEKICLHVHGVMPYIYIPLDPAVPRADHDRFIYQIVNSLEKAINISLGQSSGTAQHIFDVVHVKGIPFYGYHPKQHQFLKVLFYNPFLTKKAASLLQNAAICGRVLQSFESHIPYILQFFMDYNLYGMSFVHIKTANIVFRQVEESRERNGLEKATRCALEADTISVHILNYLSYGQSQQAHQNPGISFIWDDEIQRRKKQQCDAPPVDLPKTQDRPMAKVTDSDIYFKSLLASKLDSQQLSMPAAKTVNGKFNLPGLLGNAVYPAECLEEDNDSILNASCLPSLVQSTLVGSNNLSFLNDTEVDEEVVQALSQRTQDPDETLDEDDLSMLQILEELEREENPIDDDSILATPSQRPVLAGSQNILNRSQRLVLSQSASICGQPISSDDDEENDESLNYLNATLLVNECDNSPVPQLDGGDDSACKSALKREVNFESKDSNDGVKRSRYAPLNVTVRSSPRKGKAAVATAEPKQMRHSPRANKPVKNYSETKKKKAKTGEYSKDFNLMDCSVVLEKIDPNQFDRRKNHIAMAYDLERKIDPEAGPSKSPDIPAVVDLSYSDDEVKEGWESFYDKTLCLSPVPSDHDPLSISLSLPEPSATPLPVKPFEESSLVKITPSEDPPHPECVRETFHSYGIFDHEFDKPFFSDPKDVTKSKEIGGVFLELKQKYACPPFQSVLGAPPATSCSKTRKNELVQITPYRDPPSVRDAELWCKVRSKMKIRERPEDVTVEEESPIKMKREKTLLVLDSGDKDEGLVFKDDPNLSSYSSQRIDLNGSSHESPASLPRNLVRRVSSRKATAKSLRKNRIRLSASRKLDLSTTILQDIEEFGIKPPSSESQNASVSSLEDISALQDKNYLNLTSVSFDKDESQFTQPSLDNTYGFKMDLENLNDVKVDDESHNHLVILSLEVHTRTRDDLLPDPEQDAIEAIFYAIHNDSLETEVRPSNASGAIVVQGSVNPKRSGIKVNGIVVESEVRALEKLIEIIYFWDPDILVGYEIEMASWGYLIQRGHALSVNIPALLSRVILKKYEEVREAEADDFDDEFQRQLKVHGRIVLDVWRLMRHEINLMSYTFENIMYHVLHRRYPKHTHRDLTKWWADSRTSWIVLKYYNERARGSLEILDQLDLIGRTCELAKLFGIQFFEVLSRGSQFRVESMMLRMAKPRNFVPISPSVQQRVHMRAPEFLPLILEPESRFYVDPVIVLDFQSLYPSMMIAYNYCFSTCLGRVEHLGDANPFEFGASQLQISTKILKQLVKRDLITISPAGVAFVKGEVREGTLPRLLKEILDTRIMVKSSMKIHKDNKLLQRVLHSRQLGLKLIANVTYGYTAANYSGRMSCVEVADSILSKARETLERAIKLVDTNNKWNVKVVYGDTDSMFVQVPGRSKEEAFAIGEEIARLVTEDNPNPVKLKLEKVYQPCILQTKKRYVGYMYETADQREPVYEAKGIETVRRDGCPIVARMLEKVLRIIFETKDMSLVKQYVNRQFTKIIGGKVNIQDLTFGREFRGVGGYKPTACVPALVLTKKWKQMDRRKEPRSGERVPYVIVNGSPGLPLIKLVRSPDELLADEGLKINSFYYILKAIIPPLNRCLLLIGVDVTHWFDELRRNNLIKFEDVVLTKDVMSDNAKKSTISQYFSNSDCIIGCGRQTKACVCDHCKKEPQKMTFVLSSRVQSIERKFRQIEEICQSCCGRKYEVACSSLDCPILFIRTKKRRKLQQLEYIYENLEII